MYTLGAHFWVKKDSGAWSIPKGEFEEGEMIFDAALREFREETGCLPEGTFTELSPVKLKNGKMVYAFAVEYDMDASRVRSNSFSIEWPPKSGRIQEFPEINKAEWFSLELAREKLNPAQVSFIDELSSLTDNTTV